jgi:hypothetical protein
VILLHDPPAAFLLGTLFSKKTTTITGLVEVAEFVSLVKRRMEVAKDQHHHHPPEKTAYSIMA